MLKNISRAPWLQASIRFSRPRYELEGVSKRRKLVYGTSKDPHPVFSKIEWMLGLAATGLLIYLHVIFMRHAGALWRDEVNSVQLATLPSFSDIWHSLQYDPFPLLSTLVLRLWTSAPWGQTDLGLRVFGFMVGVSILAALWFNARVLGYSIPFISIALFGCSPFAIRFGDSIRPYGLGILFMLVTFGLMRKVTETPGPRQALFSTVAAAASVQCLYQNALLMMALCLGGVAVALRKASWRRAALVSAIGLACALSVLPYLGKIRRAQDWAVVNQEPIDLHWIWNVFSQALASPVYPILWIWVSLCAVAISTAAISLRFTLGISDKQRDLVLFSATAMVTGVASFLIFVRIASLPSQPWYYIPLIAFVAASLDTILGAFASRDSVRLCRIVFFVLILGFILPAARQGVQIRQTNIDLIASKLEKTVTKDDMILVNPWYCGVTFQRYYGGEAPWTTLPPFEDLKIHRYDLLKERLRSPNSIDPVLDKMAKTLKGGNRVWVVGGLPTLQEGQIPPDLPPAPAGPLGWNNRPYIAAWQLQASYFVRSHALRAEFLRLPFKEPVNHQEDVWLEVVEGWR